MKFLTVLAALVIQCAAKSWNSDGYSEDTFFVFSWLSYLKRFSIISLMLFSVILYYVPESRPHARRICYTLIDVTANGLKSALSTRESEFLYEKIKSKYQRARYEHPLALQKHIVQEVTTDDENLGIVQKNSFKKSKVFVNGDDALGTKEKKKSNKAVKEHRQSRQRLRNSGVKDVEPCMEITKPVYLYSEKSDECPKYTKKNTHKNAASTKGSSGSAVENYAFLISGSPQQIAMIDQKYDKDDVVIVQDPYLKLEYKECGTTTDKISSKASSSEQEGPTRDHDYNMTDSGMEAYMKEIELNSMPGSNTAKYSVTNSLNDGSLYCGGACCGSNGCFLSSRFSNKDLHSKAQATIAPLDVKNVLNMVNPKSYKSVEEANESVYMVDYNHYNPEGDRIRKPMNVSNSRKVEFRKDLNNRDKVRTQKHEESGPKMRKKKFQNNDVKSNLCCTNYHAEADDENSQFGKLKLDAKSQNLLLQKSSDDSIFDYDFYYEPILKNRLKPALVRAVNWIFGGCPEASRRAEQNREVGKEENREFSGEWLL